MYQKLRPISRGVLLWQSGLTANVKLHFYGPGPLVLGRISGRITGYSWQTRLTKCVRRAAVSVVPETTPLWHATICIERGNIKKCSPLKKSILIPKRAVDLDFVLKGGPNINHLTSMITNACQSMDGIQLQWYDFRIANLEWKNIVAWKVEHLSSISINGNCNRHCSGPSYQK